MVENNYETFKTIVNLCNMPSAVFSVEKKEDGTCGEIRMVATNEKFSMTGEDVEGQLYTYKMPKDIKLEEIFYKAAWENIHHHSYVDTTRLYGYWTENILIPLSDESSPNIRYCQYMYNLTKQMDSNKYSIIAPDIASFVIRTCLNLKRDEDFYTTMNTVTRDIREFTDSFAACIMSISPDFYKYEIISECVRNNAVSIKDIFSTIPYEIIESWEDMVAVTDCVIIRNDEDLDNIEPKAPEWVKSLRENNVKSLILVPFFHQNVIIGYLYITNFDVTNLFRIKDTVELVAFFLSSELSHRSFIDKLQTLSELDMRTGVLNRNAMNTKVDELAAQFQYAPVPFSVAFCYLTTLKTVNKEQGHDGGNNLLKDAGKVLREVFENDFIFRSAGDEFAIISTNCTEEAFEEKIEKLREKASDPNWVYFSIGYYSDKSEGKLHSAMHFANVYEKEFLEEFYLEHPDIIK